jgi:hypothetical protein
MCSNGDAILKCQLDRPSHRVSVASVKPACDVGGRDVPHQLGVTAAAFTKIAV